MTVFNATTTQKKLARFIETVDVLVEEAKLHINDDALWIRAVDPADVGMVDSQFYSTDFRSFEFDPDGENENELVVGVNTGRVADIISMGAADSTVTLDLDWETRKLNVSIDGVEYTMATIEPASIREEPTIPELDLNADLQLNSDYIERGTKAADMVSDHAVLGVDSDEGMFYFEAQGDTDDVVLELNGSDLESIETSGDASSMFSARYLDTVSRGLPSDTTVSVQVGQEMPSKYTCSPEEYSGKLTYLLAPRIENA